MVGLRKVLAWLLSLPLSQTCPALLVGCCACVSAGSVQTFLAAAASSGAMQAAKDAGCRGGVMPAAAVTHLF